MLYSESIDKLKAVLSAMHNMSQKRENLEKNLRFKLEGEIRRLRKEGGGGGGGEGGGEEEEEQLEDMKKGSLSDHLAELRLQNAALEADVVKVIASGKT